MKNGGKVSHLKPKWFSEFNRSLVVSKDLKKGDKICLIPAQILLTYDAA